MVNKKMRKVWLLLALCLTMLFGSSINAFAYVDESAAEAETEAVVVEEELTADVEAETEETDTAEEESTGVFSEAGNLSLLDDVGEDEANGLEYMTVQTKSGAVFYIVIDRSTDTENVYFLNQVDTSDLLALMEDAEVEAYENAQTEETEEVPAVTIEEEPEAEEPVVTEEKTETGTNTLALLGVLGVIGALVIGGYAFMKKKEKENGAGLEEDLEFYDDEEYENEDEAEPEFEEEEDID